MENREIKFRFWNGKKIMYINESIFTMHGLTTTSLTVGGMYYRLFGEFNLMQYTGLKDKNGKDAYEKDVIKSTNGMIGHIEYSEVHAAFIVHTYNDDPAGEWLHNYEFEIIDNVYKYEPNEA